MIEETEKIHENAPEDVTTVGMYLKYTRLKQKKSVETVAEALCIRKIYIKALEEDNYQELPPVPYGIGFLRSYANYLGLNAERIVQFYKQQALPQKIKTPVQPVVKKHTALTIPQKKHILIGLTAIVLLYALWLFVVESFTNKPLKETPIEQVQVAETLKNSTDQEEDTSAVSDPIEQISVVEEVYEEQPKQETVVPKLLIKVKGDSWIEIKDNKKVYLTGIYHKGYTFETPLHEGMQMSIGKSKNVETYINGVLTEIATPRKQVRISLDPFLEH